MPKIPFPSLIESPSPILRVCTDGRIGVRVYASPRASRARKLRYENVELSILISIHTCVHSGKENITEKPCRVTLKDIFSFLLFTTV